MTKTVIITLIIIYDGILTPVIFDDPVNCLEAAKHISERLSPDYIKCHVSKRYER